MSYDIENWLLKSIFDTLWHLPTTVVTTPISKPAQTPEKILKMGWIADRIKMHYINLFSLNIN